MVLHKKSGDHQCLISASYEYLPCTNYCTINFVSLSRNWFWWFSLLTFSSTTYNKHTYSVSASSSLGFSDIILDSSSVSRQWKHFFCLVCLKQCCWSHVFSFFWFLVQPLKVQWVPELCNQGHFEKMPLASVKSLTAYPAKFRSDYLKRTTVVRHLTWVSCTCTILEITP